MGGMIRPCSYRARCRSIEMVNARTLSENRTMYLGWSRYPPSDHSPTKGRLTKASKSSPRSLKSWWNDPEMKRRRRISKYKLYSAEANVKRSFKKGLRWFRKKCSMIISSIWTLTLFLRETGKEFEFFVNGSLSFFSTSVILPIDVVVVVVVVNCCSWKAFFPLPN